MHIIASTLVSALGSGKKPHIDAWTEGKSGLSQETNFHQQMPEIITFLGEVKGVESVTLPKALEAFLCRNNQLAWKTLQTEGFNNKVEALIEKFGPNRIGLVVGTSTSGIATTEDVFRHKLDADSYCYQKTQQMDSLAQFCCQALNIEGPSFVISTACSSSAKVFAVAQRWLNAGIVDAVVVGGVDSLCLTTVHGFNALGLVSSTVCKPLDESRDGINIGEAGGFMLLSHAKFSDETNPSPVEIAGVGESSDAYHISTPHPEGEGAQLAMLAATEQANIGIDELDYINLHGTATPSNDLSEVSGVSHLMSEKSSTWISSTKGFTGHTLGAAGITEIIFCQWMLEEQVVPANLNLTNLDSMLVQKLARFNISVPLETIHLSETNRRLQYVMSNSFGFGGNNASVILKRESAE